jgi:hypothetical protein
LFPNAKGAKQKNSAPNSKHLRCKSIAKGKMHQKNLTLPPPRKQPGQLVNYERKIYFNAVIVFNWKKQN